MGIWQTLLWVALSALPGVAAVASESDERQDIRLAITLDDLPWVGPLPAGDSAQQALERIAAVLRVHDAPATGFVVCNRAREDEGALRAWAAWGNTLGNHSAAHRDLNRTPVDEWVAGVVACDDYLQRFGDATLPLFRFPYLHQGDTAEKRARARRTIEELGLSNAHVTIDNSEWILTRAHAQALAAGDARARRAVGNAFVEHIVAAVHHADKVARRKAGRPVAQVLLLHANTVVEDYLDELLLALRKSGVQFISAEDALSDPVYARADEYVGSKGLSWLYRMEPQSADDVAWDDAQASAISHRFDPGHTNLQATTISEQLVATESMQSLVELAGRSDRMRSLIVAQRGEPVVETYFNGAGPQQAANLKSVTKSLLATLVGVALDQGWIAGIDDHIGRYMHDRFENNDVNAGITLRELLTMTSGLPPIGYGEVQASGDWVAAVLAADRRIDKDGNPFRYDTPVLQLLTQVLTNASGMTATELFDRYIAAPDGPRLAYWRTDAQGLELGGNDAYLRPRDLLELGELYRNGGKVGDRTVLSPDYVRAATSPQSTPKVSAINHGTLPVHGYGFLWWLITAGDTPAFAALGHGGQLIAVVPEHELTVVMTSRWPMASSAEHYEHMAQLLDAVIAALSG
jgi:CubicO group peptidase (beta-lactamase class C family)/peptidoglycan/xylan/chitin deacetylase (PgdA/CDA1 family)